MGHVLEPQQGAVGGSKEQTLKGGYVLGLQVGIHQLSLPLHQGLLRRLLRLLQLMARLFLGLTDGGERKSSASDQTRASKMMNCGSTRCLYPLHLVTFVVFLFVTGLALLRCRDGLQGVQAHIPGEACCYLQPGRPRRAVRLLLREMYSVFWILEKEISCRVGRKNPLLQNRTGVFHRHRPHLL